MKVYEMKRVLVPDPRLIRLRQAAWDMDIVKRPVQHFWREAELPDRRELDAIILKALGFADPEERARVQRELYEAVTDLVRSRLEKARSVEKAEDGKRLSPRAIAQELVKEFDKGLLRPFPEAFVPSGIEMETLELPEGEVEVGVDLFTAGTLRIGSRVLQVGSVPKAKFIKYAIDSGPRGEVKVPKKDDICAFAVAEYEAYRRWIEAVFDQLARSRTPSEKMVARIKDELDRLICAR